MSPEQYREYIAKMLEQIHDARVLKLIYNIVHRFFIDEAIKREGAE